MTPIEKKTIIQALKSFNEHPEKIKSILIGNLLGDGCARRRSEKANTYIQYMYSIKHLEYAKWLKQTLGDFGYCNLKDLEIKSHLDQRTNKTYFKINFFTYSFTSLNELHILFYKNSIKKIPLNIHEFLTAQALAVWVMDDGSFTKSSGRVTLHTDSFTFDDCNLLIHALKQNFNLNFALHKAGLNKKTGITQYRLVLPRREVSQLILIIKSYLHPSMLYKIGF